MDRIPGYFAGAIALVLIAVSITGCKTPQDGGDASDIKYYGYDNQRFRMQFKNYFYMQPTIDQDEILAEAYQSLRFLFGAFQWHDEFVAYKGIPHRQPKVKVDGTEVVDVDGKRRMKVSYTFDDEVVFNKSLNKSKIDFWMPQDRKAIYQLGMVGTKNVCTDEHYWTEGDFWYFWNPGKKGCPAEFKNGLVRVKASFQAIPNTLNRYPQYGWLGSGGKRLVYIAHGVDSNFTDNDAGVQAFVGTTNELNRLGFKETEKRIDEASEKHWVYSLKADGYDVELHLGLFKSGGAPFTSFGRTGLENADVFIYNGHSGLGGYLPPSRFAPLTLPKKYQIFFFNGCSTFAYYNQNYFDLKAQSTGGKGTEKLEIVTTGLEAWFAVQPFVTGSLLNDVVVAGRYPKWEQIVKNLYEQTSKYRYGDNLQWKMDPKKYSAHYQVNGDEDNPSDLATALKRD